MEYYDILLVPKGGSMDPYKRHKDVLLIRHKVLLMLLSTVNRHVLSYQATAMRNQPRQNDHIETT